MTSDENKDHPFDEKYFSSGPYATVSFAKYSQYWWSNRFYARLVRRFGPPSGRVLEIGCGLGHLLGWLVDSYQVVGTDINEWALEQARSVVPKGEFLVASAEDLSMFPDGSFQVLIAKHVVEHLPKPESAVAEMSRVISQGGLLIMATPNLDSLMRGVKKERWVGYKDPTHINLRPPANWLGLLKENLFQPKRVFSDGFWDPPYMPVLPVKMQRIIFGGPGGLQAILGWSLIPVKFGESLIVVAKKL